MAQSAVTVTPPNPTPPTNMSFTGATPPNPANYADNVYVAPFGKSVYDPTYNPAVDNARQNPNPPPFFDDGTAGALTAFAAKTAALAVGGTSVDHEGRGTEVVVTQTYTAAAAGIPGTFIPAGPLVTVSDIGAYTATPNASHPSSLSPLVNPTLTSVAAGGASGTGNATVNATGVGFTKQSVIYVSGVAYPTTFVSSTNITASAPKKATAGSLPVTVVTGGVVVTAPQNWVFT